MTCQRIVFIDWMKVIGMYFIILGHLFPVHDEYIYAFNVPLFFIISGILSKKEDDLFWEKIWRNLALPMIIICLVAAVFDMAILSHRNELSIEFVYRRPLAILLGEGGGDYGGLRSCWFIYTLILIKIVFHYTKKSIIQYIIIFLCVASCIFITKRNLELRNSFANLLISYPFFYVGYRIKPYIPFLTKMYDKLFLNVGIGIICLLILLYVGTVNGDVWMYITRYGNNYILFWIGAFSGSIMIFSISIIMGKKRHLIIETLSNGLIVILGFHQLILFFYKYIHSESFMVECFFSLLVLLTFFPIIILCKKHFPILLGYR